MLLFRVRIVKILDSQLCVTLAGYSSEGSARFQFLDEIEFGNTFGEQIKLHYNI